jgi:hypothetical protein
MMMMTEPEIHLTGSRCWRGKNSKQQPDRKVHRLSGNLAKDQSVGIVGYFKNDAAAQRVLLSS